MVRVKYVIKTDRINLTKYIYTAHNDIEGLCIYRYTKQVYNKLESRERFYVDNSPRYGFHYYNFKRKSWA